MSNRIGLRRGWAITPDDHTPSARRALFGAVRAKGNLSNSARATRADSDLSDHFISRTTVLAMAVVSGMSVANLYYSQPLLAEMGRTFSVGHAAGYIPAFTLIGLILGMLLIAPLGDMFERRSLLVKACAFAAVAATAVASAPNFLWLAAASLLLGLASIVQHLILPFAAQLAPIRDRGKTLGTIFTGLLLGALLARTASGFVGAELGWRMMYWTASGLMLVAALAVRLILPESRPTEQISYRELLGSILAIVRDEPALRELSIVGAMLFGALNAFWVNLVFFIETPPYHYGARAAGLFGLIGAVSAAVAPLAGRIADRRGARFGLTLGMVASLFSFIILWLFGHVLWALIGGVILLDVGVQAAQVSNQARIYSLLPGAPSRVNTIYMTVFFAGGAVGAALGAHAWIAMQWDGVCIVGIAMLLIALGVHLGSGEEIIPSRECVPAK